MRTVAEAIRRTRSGVASLDADLILDERDSLRRRLAKMRSVVRRWKRECQECVLDDGSIGQARVVTEAEFADALRGKPPSVEGKKS